MSGHAVVPQFTVHDRLRKAREEVELSQQELADSIDVSVRTVSRYETGEVRPRRIVGKAWALRCGVDFDWLWSGKYAPRDSNPEPSDCVAVA